MMSRGMTGPFLGRPMFSGSMKELLADKIVRFVERPSRRLLGLEVRSRTRRFGDLLKRSSGAGSPVTSSDYPCVQTLGLLRALGVSLCLWGSNIRPLVSVAMRRGGIR